MLSDLQNFFTARELTKFATKLTQQYPPYLKRIATLKDIQTAIAKYRIARFGWSEWVIIIPGAARTMP